MLTQALAVSDSVKVGTLAFANTIIFNGSPVHDRLNTIDMYLSNDGGIYKIGFHGISVIATESVSTFNITADGGISEADMLTEGMDFNLSTQFGNSLLETVLQVNGSSYTPSSGLTIVTDTQAVSQSIDVNTPSVLGGEGSTPFHVKAFGYQLKTAYNTLEDYFAMEDGTGDPAGTPKKGGTLTMTVDATADYWVASAFDYADKPVKYTYGRKVGDKRYELSNHLGNVLSVVSDKKIPTLDEGSLKYFNADIKAYNDYYPFGMLQPGRHANTSDYRYGFQGQEMDDEIKGEGNSVNYTYRMHDPRAGRFFSMDPLASKFPWYTPYSFSGNKVIQYLELEGLEEGLTKSHVNSIQNIDETFVNSLVDMANSKSINTNSIGWPRDPQHFWNEFKDSQLGSEALSKDNLMRISEGKSAIVDEQWNDVMKRYDLDGNMNEVIEHHHHNKGRTAYPRPKSKHTSKAWSKVLHQVEKRYGKVYQQSGQIAKAARNKGVLKRGVGRVLAILDFVSILTDSPHSPVYMFGPTSTLDRAFYDDASGMYFEYKDISKDGNTVTIQFFETYNVIDGEWRGVIKVGGEHTLQKDPETGQVVEKKKI